MRVNTSKGMKTKPILKVTVKHDYTKKQKTPQELQAEQQFRLKIKEENQKEKQKQSRKKHGIEEESRPKIQNVVALAQLNTKTDIDLSEIAFRVEGSRLNLKRFPALIMRKSSPKCTILLFKSGKIIIIGACTEQDSEIAAHYTAALVQKISLGRNKQTTETGYVGLIEHRITNIVANGNLGYKINLVKFAADERRVIKNQKFPGIVYKYLDQTMVKTILVFATGKLVFTGARSMDDIHQVYLEMQQKLIKYRVADKTDIETLSNFSEISKEKKEEGKQEEKEEEINQQ